MLLKKTCLHKFENYHQQIIPAFQLKSILNLIYKKQSIRFLEIIFIIDYLNYEFSNYSSRPFALLINILLENTIFDRFRSHQTKY